MINKFFLFLFLRNKNINLKRITQNSYFTDTLREIALDKSPTISPNSGVKRSKTIFYINLFIL